MARCLKPPKPMRAFREGALGGHTTEELAAQVARIYERAQNETLALIQSQPTEKIVAPVREWMSATQLAEYWQLYNDKNEPTTAGILKWAKRGSRSIPTAARIHG
jgi:hypothetical protein